MTARILALGSLQLESDGTRLPSMLGKPLRCALLVTLAAEAEQTRDVILGRLWPERDQRSARHALSQMLYELRNELGAEWIDASGEVLRLGETVRADVLEFEALVASAQVLEALTLYRGEFLMGTHLAVGNDFQIWAELKRATLKRTHRKARRQAFDMLRATGDADAALTCAREWADLEPLDDEAQRRFIEMLAEFGRRAEAREQFDRYRRLLAAEDFELRPLDELTVLMESIRSGRFVPSLPGERRVIRRRSDDLPAQAPVDRPPSSDNSIAVLPFANLSSEPGADYLSDGIAEELIHVLASTPGLHATSRTSSFALRASGLGARQIGEALGVKWIVEGSVQKAGNRLRISARLVSTENEAPRWSARFDRELEDVLAIQDELGTSIVASLLGHFGIAPPARVRTHTDDPQAYDLYLLGRFHWNRRDAPSLQRAVQAFEAALALDPGYARAYSGLADVHFAQAQFFHARPGEAMPPAEAAARKALALDDSLAEAHNTWAHILDAYHWRWHDAEREYRRALALDPRYAIAYAWYSALLTALGEHERADGLARRALDLEPLSVPIVFQYGAGLYRARDYARAAAVLARTIEMDPDFFAAPLFLGLTWVAMGDAERAAAMARPVLERYGPVPGMLLVLAMAEASLGRTREAELAVGQLAAVSRETYVPAAFMAVAHAWLGRRDEAFADIERAFEERYGQFIYLKVDPAFDPLRDDARFDRYVERMGLSDPRPPAAPSGVPPGLAVAQKPTDAGRSR